MKFTRSGGVIKIVAELVQPFERGERSESMSEKMFENNDFSQESEAESDENDAVAFENSHNLKNIFKPIKDREKLVISVHDTGIGIKKEDRIKLFQLFGCLQSTSQMNSQGIGLGLVISESIVKFFDGTIGVKSKYGKGSKFAFCFVLKKVAKERQLTFTSQVNEIKEDQR